MRFIDKRFIIGFVTGFICFPVLYICLNYLYIKYDGSKTAFAPPDIKPVEEAIHLDWDVKTLDGETVNLKDKFKGKIVFLNFWATWCPPCTQEMPSIESLYARYKGKIEFACVSNEPIQALRKFKDAEEYNMPIYQFEGMPPKVFGVKMIPVTYIVSGDRNSFYRHVGGADWAHENVIAYFENALGEVK